MSEKRRLSMGAFIEVGGIPIAVETAIYFDRQDRVGAVNLGVYVRGSRLIEAGSVFGSTEPWFDQIATGVDGSGSLGLGRGFEVNLRARGRVQRIENWHEAPVELPFDPTDPPDAAAFARDDAALVTAQFWCTVRRGQLTDVD